MMTAPGPNTSSFWGIQGKLGIVCRLGLHEDSRALQLLVAVLRLTGRSVTLTKLGTQCTQAVSLQE